MKEKTRKFIIILIVKTYYLRPFNVNQLVIFFMVLGYLVGVLVISKCAVFFYIILVISRSIFLL